MPTTSSRSQILRSYHYGTKSAYKTLTATILTHDVQKISNCRTFSQRASDHDSPDTIPGHRELAFGASDERGPQSAVDSQEQESRPRTEGLRLHSYIAIHSHATRHYPPQNVQPTAVKQPKTQAKANAKKAEHTSMQGYHKCLPDLERDHKLYAIFLPSLSISCHSHIP